MKITGQILKENRERKRMTIAEVSLATKITTKTIAAMEEGAADNLPPKTFLRGFVRSYALYLGLDVDEILRTFHEEMGSTLAHPAGSAKAIPPAELAEKNSRATESLSQEEKPSKEREAAGRPTASANMSPMTHASVPRSPDQAVEMVARSGQIGLTKYLIGGLFVVLIFLIIYFKGKMDSYESERAPQDLAATTNTPNSTVPTDSTNGESLIDVDGNGTQDPQLAPGATPTEGQLVKASPAPTAASATTSTVTPSPQPTSPPVSATPLPTPTAKPSPTTKATPLATPLPMPTPKPSPVATPTPKPSPVATPGASPAASPRPSPSATPRVAKPTEVLIEALDTVELEVSVDNDPPRSVRLRADQIQAIQAKRKATIRFSDGGAVNVLVNGVDRGVPGDLGRPLRVEYP
jgi:cytoskeleton protein RodZ